MTLSKSDFILASSCPKKLVYKKAGYPTSNDTKEFMRMLAQGGYVVGLYAQLMYPEGIEVESGSPEATAFRTRELLVKNESIVLFEASILSGDKIARIDILEKRGNELHIIEVKSVSHDSENDSTAQRRKLNDYIKDVAFQAMVAMEAYPEYTIRTSLFIPDKTKRTNIEGLAGWFNITDSSGQGDELEELPAQQCSRFNRPDVRFIYSDHPDYQDKLSNLKADCLLSIKPCDAEVQDMLPQIMSATAIHLDILRNGIQPHHYKLTKGCADCEFRTDAESPQHGFNECWGDMAGANPHIFDLYYGGGIGHYRSGFYFDELISQGKSSFHDLDVNRFANANGEIGSRAERQLLQYRHTIDGTEYIDPLLKTKLESLTYPLHFIDFETYISALPHHAGMRPYEKITFQWSCHTIQEPGAPLTHSEYLNDQKAFPNFTFAEKLMDHIGDSGTPLMWSAFENTTLKEVLAQIDTYGYQYADLRNWLLRITSDKVQQRPGRFVDMNDICLKYYFHPEMKGKTSIKKVLPAIWNNNAWLHDDPWFAEYKPQDEITLNPYSTLGSLIPELEAKEVVDEGTAAMMAYHDMMYGATSTDEAKRKLIKQSLLNYCKLDTISMVIIWKYWMSKVIH